MLIEIMFRYLYYITGFSSLPYISSMFFNNMCIYIVENILPICVCRVAFFGEINQLGNFGGMFGALGCLDIWIRIYLRY